MLAASAGLLTAVASAVAGPPGVAIDRSPDPHHKFIGSPAIAVLPNGDYVASHDWFGPGTKYNRTSVFRSSDRGKTWWHVSDIVGQWWSSLFTHEGRLYIIGVSERYGNVVIRRSGDGGQTWTEPKDATTGLLLDDGKYHCAPVPVVVHNGRVWRAMEDSFGGGGWGKHFRALMMSAPADADLLDRTSWTFSNRLARDPVWLDGQFNGWLEGNAVVTRAGEIVNILRVDCPSGGKAAVVRLSPDGRKATFDADNDFIDFPGGAKKFTIRFDPQSKLYWSLTNYIQEKDRSQHSNAGLIRNTSALICSPDLKTWTVRSIVLYHPDVARHGFQYIDWLFEDNDLIAVSRTAYDDERGDAHRQHDANYLTFHRIEDFRERTMADLPQAPQPTVHETAQLRIEGFAFTLKMLREDATAFANRTYVWKEVPEGLQGWHFTQLNGGGYAQIKVAAKQNVAVRVATATKQSGIDMTGWEPVAGLSFHYTDKNHSRLDVYCKKLKSGEQVEVPQGNWTGGILLVPGDDAP
jgi:hypothetical protein